MTERRKNEIIWNIYNHVCSEISEEEVRKHFEKWLERGFEDVGPTDYDELGYCMEQGIHPEWFY